MAKGKLPYSNSTADPIRAQANIRRDLQKFGVSTINFGEDFLIIIIEMGIFSFEEIFIGYITDASGNRLGEVIKEQLPQIIKGQFQLPTRTKKRSD